MCVLVLLLLEHVCVNALFRLLVFVGVVISSSCLCYLVYSVNTVLVMLLCNTCGLCYLLYSDNAVLVMLLYNTCCL